ncbi:hypothetical protein ALI22I_00780 [Saccharothrix sp. ALI-22-I]|uniref:hypothetical protein n=1 Tax=Saccharothrix sp. ALI-22-I TaxID=1933778 RepID=UPI00097C0F20|nr:hypothetical protein [Saccharothrix sp. ALI-22-I]ONI92965.1 hypothetical protein ALI22I_00780 [Saccharothrix sp. ALI-22-I]
MLRIVPAAAGQHSCGGVLGGRSHQDGQLLDAGLQFGDAGLQVLGLGHAARVTARERSGEPCRAVGIARQRLVRP